MNIFKKIYCRVFQTVFKLAIPLLPYREPEILNNVEDISNLLDEKGINSVLLVTDEGLRSSGITAPLENSLSQSQITCVVYDKTCANPTSDNVEQARECYLQNKCQAIIAFGGGSSIDCAKAVGARIAYPKKSLAKLKGLLKVLKKTPTLIAVPTTAGTGSEVTLASVITDAKTKHKYVINSFPLIPSYAVLDASVTVSLPPHLTATTGMDALTHAVEAYIGRSTTKETREKALQATKLIFKNILVAYKDGQNLTARANMLQAAYLAGIAFTKSYVGYIHAVAHSLGGQYNYAHGLTNSVVMPYLLKEYGKSTYKKLYKLALFAGVVTKEDSEEQGANKFIKAIEELNEKMGIPNKLEIDEKDISTMATHADEEANPLYPVPKLMDKSELEKIYYLVKKD